MTMRKIPATEPAARLATAAVFTALLLHANFACAGQELSLATLERLLADDPNLLAKVAARNSMTTARMMGEALGEVLKKVREYLAEQDAAASALARENPLDGRAVPLAVVRQSLMNDPNLWTKVAARNGMTPVRFMGQEEGRILQMTRAYIAEQQAASTRESTASVRSQP